MKQILDAAKPEHAWFCERDGKRGGILIVNLDSPSDVPRLAEPWFLSFNAEVEFRVAMTAEDLAHADLDALGKKWGQATDFSSDWCASRSSFVRLPLQFFPEAHKWFRNAD